MIPATLTPQQRAQVDFFEQQYQKIASEIDLKHYEKKRFGPWNPYWHVYDTVRKFRTGTPQRLLSLGCGTGGDALRYARMGYDIDGIDISPRAVAAAQAAAAEYHVEQQARFSVQAAESLEFPEETFDIVVGVNVLHHTDTSRSIAETSRVLKPGGLAIFKEPLSTPVRDRIRRSRLVTWLIPVGMKNIPSEVRYEEGVGNEERMLDNVDFSLFRAHFQRFELQQWRVLALLSVLFSRKPFLERCDWILFKCLPIVRRLGDQAVLTATKSCDAE